MTAADGLARQIREMRVAMCHTQLSLAVAIGSHPMTVSRWERGLARPHPVFFNAIRDTYIEYKAACESPGFGLCHGEADA